MVSAANNVRLRASSVPTSGLGAPARTPIPSGERAISTMVPVAMRAWCRRSSSTNLSLIVRSAASSASMRLFIRVVEPYSMVSLWPVARSKSPVTAARIALMFPVLSTLISAAPASPARTASPSNNATPAKAFLIVVLPARRFAIAPEKSDHTRAFDADQGARRDEASVVALTLHPIGVIPGRREESGEPGIHTSLQGLWIRVRGQEPAPRNDECKRWRRTPSDTSSGHGGRRADAGRERPD